MIFLVPFIVIPSWSTSISVEREDFASYSLECLALVTISTITSCTIRVVSKRSWRKK